MSHQDDNLLWQQFHRVVADYMRAVESGRQPDRDNLLAEHPELADPLCAYFSLLDKLSPDPAVEATQPLSESGLAPTLPPESSYRAESERGLDPKAGSTVRYFGDYELVEEIARGGMGVVYRARQVSLNRPVALKMILSGQLAGEAEVERFRAEAEAAAKLDHPGIVPIHEIGQHQGQHYFSMGYVDGTSLAERMAEGPLPGREAGELVEKIARAVAYAHDNGVIHRDLKPGNVLLDQGGSPRVTDFGLAKQLHGDSDLTATGQILGTPSYMAPEQALGREVDELADVYALGAILYAVLTARPPHQAASPVDTVRSVIEREPIAPRQLDRSIPRDLETICLRALAKEPARRYATAADFADDVQRYLRNEPIVARRVGRVEKGWLWCRRNPKTMAAIAAAAAVLLVVSSAFWQWRAQTRADGLVEALLAADADEVGNIIADMRPYHRRIEPQLRELLADEPQSLTERRQQLHARVALVVEDESQMEPLMEELLRPTLGDARYIGIILAALGPYQDDFLPDLWQTLRDPAVARATRFRAGLALAVYDPAAKHWSEEDDRFLVDQLVSRDAESQPEFRSNLRLRSEHLLPHLLSKFADGESVEQIAAARGVADYASDQTELIAELIVEATSDQYTILYPLLGQVDDRVRKGWLDLIREGPAVELPLADRVTVGQRRAGAAISLLRQNERESMFSIFHVTDDPESLTQFIHRCRDRGVTPAELIDCLDRANLARGDLTDEHRKVQDLVMFGLILALGDFQLNEVPLHRRESLVAQLHDWHATDPSSGIHGATGWLLRHWEYEHLTRAVDRTPVPYNPRREWFTLEVQVETRTFLFVKSKVPVYFTFVVFPAGEYMMGSPRDDPYHTDDEELHRVTLTRPLAVIDREVTWEQFRMMGTVHHDAFEQQFSRRFGSQDPAFGMSWFETVEYCRWLTIQTGLPEWEQCYADPQDLELDAEGNPTEWPLHLDRRGFRLLTESEWEYICRSGTRSTFSFGSDDALIGHYGWYGGNAEEWSRAVGQKRPNLRGMFDVHGNMAEWCHDWFSEIVGSMTDPVGPAAGSMRVLRGGNWDLSPRILRSADRVSIQPTYRSTDIGFRLALSLPAPAGEQEQAAEP